MTAQQIHEIAILRQNHRIRIPGAEKDFRVGSVHQIQIPQGTRLDAKLGRQPQCELR